MDRKIRYRKLFCAFLTLFTLSYLVWRIGFSIPYDHGTLSVVLGWVLMAAELVGAAELLVYFWLDTGGIPAVPHKTNQPDVDVFVTACGEPVELLERTLKACKAMRYKGRFQVYLLDDKPSEEMRSMAEGLGAVYFTREEHVNAKAGNLNAAIARTSAPLIAVFDADMCPRKNFLERTTTYMSKKMAYVQTPQSFRNPDLFQAAFGGRKSVPGEQDFFYRSIEPARNRTNAVVLAGSNMLLSRKALEDVGGFDTQTLTEDFATGIELLKKGWQTSCTDETLADGLSPDSLKGLIRQRRRWATGCIQAGKQTEFMSSKNLRMRQKLSYIISISYWYFPVKRLIYFLAPLAFAIAGVTVMRCTPVTAAIFWLPMFLLTNIGIIWYSKRTRTVGWSMLYETVLSPFLFTAVLGATFGKGGKVFEVTDKSGRKGWSAAYLLPFIAGAALNIWGLVSAIDMSRQDGTWYYILLILWIVYHLYMQVCAFVFVLSSRKNRTVDEDAEPEDVVPKKNWYSKIKLIQLLTGFGK